MATRAATFSAKIHTLSDYHFRTRHGILPIPSGIDIANTVKYFSQTLLSVLKDVPSIPIEMMSNKELDHSRVALFPILDYKELFHILVQLLDVVPLVHMGSYALGQSLLHTIVCLLPFLEHHYIDTLPYLVSSTMTTFPESLHQDIIDTLCTHLLPFSITDAAGLENQSYATLSIPSILLTVFQYSKNPAHHFHLLECLMSLKKDVIKDLLCVIAYGTSAARSPSAVLLFYYWPTLNPTPYENKNLHNFSGWRTVSCQRENCLGGENNESIQMCFDPSIAIGTGDHPPPLYVCHSCSQQIRLTEYEGCHLVDILLPVQQISATCENKSCQSANKLAVSTCFSMECASSNNNRPVRYCQQCHGFRHNDQQGERHVVHLAIESAFTVDKDTGVHLMEAIVSLLKEAQPIADSHIKEISRLEQHLRATSLADNTIGNTVADGDGNHSTSASSGVLEERRLLSRYGVYLLVATCKPVTNSPPESLGRLLSMLFQWFDATAYFQDDQSGNMLERLKSEYVHKFLMDVCETHFDVFAACLLPHPPDFARVGGHWDKMTSATNRIKEGFNRIFCLVPYEIISRQVWNFIMGHWMEAIRSEVPDHEISELRMVLSKVLDPEMSPLGFDAHQMYDFFMIRFRDTKAAVQEQALLWLQILCELDVVVPLSLIFKMFSDGVQSLHPQQDTSLTLSAAPSKASTTVQQDNKASLVPTMSYIPSYETNLLKDLQSKSGVEFSIPCFALMLDILVKQMELQEVDQHQGLEHIVSQEALFLLQQMITAPRAYSHVCTGQDNYDCALCETCIIFYQYALDLLKYICPYSKESCSYEKVSSEKNLAEDVGQQPWDGLNGDETNAKGFPEGISAESQQIGNVLPSQALPFGNGAVVLTKQVVGAEEELSSVPLLPLFTATVETVIDTELQTVAIIPTEEVVRAVAHAVTLSETDVGVAKVSVAQATIVDENAREMPSFTVEVSNSPTVDEDIFWNTSQGRFKFSLAELPASLQMIYTLLKELNLQEDQDVNYHILSCLEILCFRADCLIKAAKEHRGFLIWCQENLLISSLWHCLHSECSHVACIAVRLLIHCLTLPSGADTFWNVVEDNFHNENWKIRFSAVERVIMICRFIDVDAVHQFPIVQSSIANAFSYLISSLDDASPYVSQRAYLYLDTVPGASLKCLCWCLEVQFDQVIVDRPMILQILFQLYNCIPDRSVLNWEFFLNRFDTLFLEVQVTLERSGDIAYPRDLRNSNMASETFMQKIVRAQEALNPTSNQTLRSLSVSLGSKLRYKRAMSAPAGTLPKQDKTIIISRQFSAPVLKRKCSKFGVGYAHHPLATSHFPNQTFADGHVKDNGSQEDNSFLSMFHRHMETEERDQDTIHLLVFLLMQFLSEPEHAYPSDQKAIAKTQSIVLRHLKLLLGYSPQDKGFCIPPAKMRASPIFNAFLSNLPKVLDRNFKMSSVLLPFALPVLLYCPAPLRALAEELNLSYSLYSLPSRCRLSWLSTVCLLFYKYRYNAIPLAKHAIYLARIIVNTLTCHSHYCKGTLYSAPYNAADTSQSGDIGNPPVVPVIERATPPYSPVVTITGPTFDSRVRYQKTSNLASSPPPDFQSQPTSDAAIELDEIDQQSWKPRTMPPVNEVSDTEPELEAIPESPKSESPGLGSSLDSFGELDVTSDRSITRQARIQVEDSGVFSADRAATVTQRPPLKIATVATVVHGRFPPSASQPGVDFKMAEQLHAFHRSFDRNSLDLNEGSLLPANDRKVDGDGTEGSFLREMTVHSDYMYIGKLIANPDEGGGGGETKQNSRVHELSLRSDINSIMVPSKLSDAESARAIEELNARRLESSIFRRREMPPYLFQPIKAHPVTSTAGTAGNVALCSNLGSKPISCQMDSFETSTKEANDRKSSGSKVCPEPCWTIAVGLPKDKGMVGCNVPSPERLLPVGSMKSDYRSNGTDDHNSDSLPVHDSTLPSRASKDFDFIDFNKAGKTSSAKDVAKDSNGSEETTSSNSLLVLPQVEAVAEPATLFIDEDAVQVNKNIPQSDLPISERLQDNVNDVEDENGADTSFISDLPQMILGSFQRTSDLLQSNKNVSYSNSRPLTKAFDLHLETFYQSVGFISGVCADELPIGHQIQQNQNKDHDECREKYHFRQKRQRKLGSGVNEQQQKDGKNAGTWKSRKGEFVSSGGSGGMAKCPPQQHSLSEGQKATIKIVVDRCPECGVPLERYSNEELGLCIVALATFIHREPALMAPLLPEVLHVVARIASIVTYPWDNETNVYIPGNARSVARQFLRCVLHQLAHSGVFIQIFQSTIENDVDFFRTIAVALVDFTELNPAIPLQLLLDGMIERSPLQLEAVLQTLSNVSIYIGCLQPETSPNLWLNLVPLFDNFFRRFLSILPVPNLDSMPWRALDITPTLCIVCSILRIPGLNPYKAILEPISKIISFAIQSSYLKYQTLLEVCHLCNRAFPKERDKLFLSRTVVFDLVQALKFKTNIPDDNLLKLVQFVVQDAGGTMGPSLIVEGGNVIECDVLNIMNTGASECMRQYFAEALEFISDVHTIGKIKSNFRDTGAGINEDTLGGTLKAGIAQYLAVEITRANNRENRAFNRYLPWLYNSLPTNQQGPKEFLDCLTHVRLLSWLLLGSLYHCAIFGNNSNLVCQPIPLEASCHIAEHIQVILAGFAEQSKASVLHMSSLFHAFLLCQIWTMYCEQLAALNLPGTENYHAAALILSDFWAKVTPGILQLLSSSSVLAEMVTLHFLSLIEALIDCNSSVLAKLFPMWRPILNCHYNQLPVHLMVRLKACENRLPPSKTKYEASTLPATLLKWMQRLQFKMGQIEVQSSAATQFYFV